MPGWIRIAGLQHQLVAGALADTSSRCAVLLLHQRAEYGVEKTVSVQNLEPEAIAQKLQELAKAGESLPK